MTTDPVSCKQALNRRLPEILHIAGVDEPIAFFCECDSAACYRAVWISSSEYEWNATEPSSVVAHEVAHEHTQTREATRSAA
jgi:hypothetical protein